MVEITASYCTKTRLQTYINLSIICIRARMPPHLQYHHPNQALNSNSESFEKCKSHSGNHTYLQINSTCHNSVQYQPVTFSQHFAAISPTQFVTTHSIPLKPYFWPIISLSELPVCQLSYLLCLKYRLTQSTIPAVCF